MTLLRVFGDLGDGSVPGETQAGTTVFLRALWPAAHKLRWSETAEKRGCSSSTIPRLPLEKQPMTSKTRPNHLQTTGITEFERGCPFFLNPSPGCRSARCSLFSS